MKRQAINPPNDWGAGFEMNQAEVISEYNEIIKFSGQTSLVSDDQSEMGLRVEHPDNQGKQMEFILDSIDKLLDLAGMTRKNIIHITFYTTNMKGFLENYEIYSNWIKEANVQPTQSAIGIKELVMPEMKLEIEITGAR
jgi:enamine deaminase RidA (YjgF/YER057c/UK114 family)